MKIGIPCVVVLLFPFPCVGHCVCVCVLTDCVCCCLVFSQDGLLLLHLQITTNEKCLTHARGEETGGRRTTDKRWERDDA